MKEHLNRKCNIYQSAFISIVSALGVLLFVLLKFGGGGYETNDDRIINEIFSGAMTGRPEPHAIYINYLIGIFLSGLYSITTAMPWYGIFLLSCYVLINSAVLTILLNKGRTIKEQAWLWLLGMFVVLCNLYVFSVLQYTTISGALAVAGYVWFILDDKKKRSYSIFGLFELLSVLLRRDAMLMVQPIGMCVVGAFLLTKWMKGSMKLKECIAEVGKIFITLAVVITVFFIGNNVIGDYSSTEWKRYKEYNDLRTQLVDYYGYPEYEECKDILDKYAVSELEYYAVRRYYLLDNVLENECMEELILIASAQYKEKYPVTIVGILKRMVNYFRYDKCFGYEIAVPAMYILVSLLLVLCKKWKEILTVIALAGSRYMVFAYLLIKGRTPYRVVNVLFFAELFLLLAILVKSFFESGEEFKKGIKAKCVMTVVLAAILPLAISSSYKEAKINNELNKNYEAAIKKLFDYMEEKEGGFVVCNEVTTYSRGTALDAKRYQGQNSLVAGGWFYYSPMMNDAIENYKQKYSDNMYCVVFKDVPGFDHSYVLEILAQKYNVTLELEDTLHLEELKLSYEVYKLEGGMR